MVCLVLETKLILCLCVLFFTSIPASVVTARPTFLDVPDIPDSDKVKEFTERLAKLVDGWGHELKAYEVATDDGFILKLHRLVRKDQTNTKSPVLIMPGIISCSSTYFANKESLAYRLTEEGYDVWVANVRGSLYSMKHKQLKPSNKKFWDFSFHEIGVYDAPAFIHKIKSETNVERVHYVGFSMGTTVFLVMASSRTSVVKDEVASITLIAPVANPKYYKRINNKYKRVLAKAYLKLVGTVFRGDILSHHKYSALAVYKVCKSRWLGWICEKLLRHRSEGRDLYDHLNSVEVIPFFPCGTSVKTFQHFIQIAEAGKFQQYDFGKNNHLKYQQPSPPEYDLRAIDDVMYLIAGGNDSDADKRDIKWLSERLKQTVYIHEPFEHFDHRDFEYSTEIGVLGRVVAEVISAHDDKRHPDFGK